MHAPLRRSALFLALLAIPAAVFAQDHSTDHVDAKELDRVLVRASPIATTAENLTRPVEVLAGERLDEAKASTLGETLNRLPGVQSTYFGPGVGRPVIRGFEGARVQVLNDGLASGDVSTVSVDHAVSIEPFLANQIEVLKGPATLLYGSGAIGGAVNVVDGRVPEAHTEQPLEGRAELRAGTVNDERTGMVRLDGTAGDFVFHVDALHRETGDYEIPGFAENHAAHGEAEEEAEDELGAYGVLPNSALRTDSAAIGASWVGERGFVGLGSSLFNTRYGVPGHAHEEHADEPFEGEPVEEEAHGAEAVRIVLDQRRHELRAGIDALGAFDSLRVKLARTDYTHTEFEGEDVGTVFDNASTELRAELAHRAFGGWDGALGLQGSHRDFEAIGAEAFVPASASRDLGVFWLGRRGFGTVDVELGLRHDRHRVEVDEADAIGGDRDFDTTSLSAAARWNISPDLHFSLGLDRAQRAPTAEELYSDGFHVATGSVEIGLPTLDVETSNRAEFGLHWHAGPVSMQASLFHARFDDFIYLADAGLDAGDGVPVRAWTQADARFTGAEAEIDWLFLETESSLWSLRVFGDAVRARLAGDGVRTQAVSIPLENGGRVPAEATLALEGPLPRIAPARFGAQLRWESGAWRASLGATRVMRQDDVAADETETPGYTLVDAHLAWHRDTLAGNAWEVFLDGRNLLDEDARVHTSPLKDLAPLPGRGVSFGVRVYF